MNERIEQLAKLAAKEMNVQGTYTDYKFRQKFAELIVNECCSIIEVDLATNKVKAETDNEGRIWVNAQLTFSQLIKSRFEIKE